MPSYIVTDPRTNQRKRVTGDHPPTDADMAEIFAPARTWTDTAVDALPLAGGAIGSLVGAGKWNPLGMAGAALGGAAGEFTRQIVDAARGKFEDIPTTPEGQFSEAGKQALLQAGLEGGGRVAFGAGARVVKGLQRLTEPGVAKAAAKGTVEHLPFVGPPIRGAVDAAKKQIEENALTDTLARVENPRNIQRGFKATQQQATKVAQKRGMNTADIEDVLKSFDKPERVEMNAPTLETGQGVTGAVPHSTGSASYGPRGDLKAWLARKMAEDAPAQAATPAVQPATTVLTPQERQLLATLDSQKAMTTATLPASVNGKVSLSHLSEDQLARELDRLLEKFGGRLGR